MTDTERPYVEKHQSIYGKVRGRVISMAPTNGSRNVIASVISGVVLAAMLSAAGSFVSVKVMSGDLDRARTDITETGRLATRLDRDLVAFIMGQQNNRDREGLLEIINDFESKDVDCVALACTDLQLLIPKHPTLKIFDTNEILADATVSHILEQETK